MTVSKTIDRSTQEIAANIEACRLCGCFSFTPFLTTDQYCLVQCVNCRVVFLSPQPSKRELRRMSNALYSSDSYKDMYFDSDQRLYRRYGQFLKQISKHKEGGRLLDIGCSYGFFLDAVRETWETYGLEVCERSSRFARDNLGIEVLTASIADAGFSSGYFDVITMWDVLEHTPSPKSALDEAARVLNDEGLLFIQCPNIRSLMAQLTGYKHWAWLCIPDHLFQFSPRSLKTLLGKSGFEILCMRTWEPLDEFLDNLLATINLNPFQSGSRRAHVCYLVTAWARKAMRLILSPLVWPLQRIWWSLGKGALIQTYAQKR